ncbi:MAG: GNAT family N-acetyltransferase [Phycisphaerales bacterium]
MTTAQPRPNLDPTARRDWIEPKPFGVQAVRVERSRLLEAARALVADAPGPKSVSAERFLTAAAAHGLDLDNTWAVLNERGAIAEVALATPGSGRTHMLFTSPAKNQVEAERLAAAIDASCRAVQSAGLAQALLEPGQTVQAAAFERAGFRRLAALGYLRRANPRVRRVAPPPLNLPAGVTVEHWTPGADEDFALALERSYADTLDCPELCGLRDTHDVLESHKAAGVFDPTLWWLVRVDGEPQGAMLFAPGHGGAHIELVYLGVAPAARGTGLGKTLLAHGLGVLAGRPEPSVTCAVDQRNEPAKRLYGRAGFVEFAERIAYIRPVAGAVTR